MIKEKDIFENVEYLLISYHGTPVITFDGKEINGKSKAEIQYLLGKDYGEKNFNFSMKVKGKLKNETGGIRGIKIGSSNNNLKLEDMENKEIRKEIDALKANNFELITKLIDEKYQIQIKHLENDLKQLEKDYSELEKEYNSLISQVEKNESNENNMLTSLLKLLPLDKLTGKPTSLASEQTNKQLDIRPEILNVLNEVDYTKLSDSDVNQYASLLKQFTNQLPKKV